MRLRLARSLRHAQAGRDHRHPQAQLATIPGGDPERPRVLRLDFPGCAEDLQPVSWETWCRVFERRQVVFLFHEHLKSGRRSNFFAFDSPFREDG